MQPLTVSTFQLLYTVKAKGGKPHRKPYSLPYDLRNPYRNLKTDTSNSQYYAQKPNKIVYVHDFGFRALDVS
jgi:hypothetical protein